MTKVDDRPSLSSFPVPASGPLLLACGKCQRRLRQSGDPEGIAPLKKLLKQHSKHQPGSVRPHLLKVPCLKICPKYGITIATAAQTARHECSILRTRGDVDALYRALQPELPVCSPNAKKRRNR